MTIQQNRITLAKVKYAAFASQETNCFTADVLFDGRKVAVAENAGHGGCTNYGVAYIAHKGDAHAQLAKAEAFAKSLPAEINKCFCRVPADCTNCKGTGQYASPVSLESLIDSLVTDYLTTKDIERQFNRDFKAPNKVVYVEEGKVYTSTWKGGQLRDQPQMVASVRKKYPAARILTGLPRDEAFPIYRQAMLHG